MKSMFIILNGNDGYVNNQEQIGIPDNKIKKCMDRRNRWERE